MKKFILGKKIGASQIFDEKGNFIPVTLIKAGPCKIVQVKTKEKDGYEAFQLGFEETKRKIKKTMKGKEFKYLKEFRPKGEIERELKGGEWINVAVFQPGEKIDVSGISKGKGFQGAVKRWRFHGKNATHGNRHDERTLGSTGMSFPQRVIKGKKMPGRMGGEKVTIKNLKIVKIDPENNILAVRGAVPGKRGTPLEIKG